MTGLDDGAGTGRRGRTDDVYQRFGLSRLRLDHRQCGGVRRLVHARDSRIRVRRRVAQGRADHRVRDEADDHSCGGGGKSRPATPPLCDCASPRLGARPAPELENVVVLGRRAWRLGPLDTISHQTSVPRAYRVRKPCAFDPGASCSIELPHARRANSRIRGILRQSPPRRWLVS
jgi:hypothetical protein